VRILRKKNPIGRGAESKRFRVVFLIILCSVFAISCVQTNDLGERPATEAKPAAADTARVTQIDDAKIKQLLKPNGKPLLVNFWATWCGPCREEFPDLVKIDAEYRGRIDFFTVSLDFVEELNTGVPKFLSEMNAEMPTYLLTSADENTLISSIAKQWNGALPFTILYNEKGEVTYLHEGKVNPETLKSEIEKTLVGKNGG
jgi:thiol-disulfide isomerase/thioredoxin